MAEAQAGQRVVLFLDAAHFIYTVYLGFLWCFERIFLRSPAGRQRFNVLGCLNAVSRQVHRFTNEGYINAQSVCELLSILAEFYGPALRLSFFMVKAKYHRWDLVRAQAQALGIELEFLPSYSPNLNLIERYWKWVKKQCLYSQCHVDFAAMKAAILTCLTWGHQRNKEELASLLTWNFQSFTNVTILHV